MLTLVLGGARSGKSRYAQSLIGQRDAVFIATARRDVDREMRARIERHRSERPRHWITVEEAEGVPHVVRNTPPLTAPVLIDCVTLWLSNLLERQSQASPRKQQDIVLSAVQELAEASRSREVIAVSNEIGLGIVPTTRLGRRFRDIQGWANQLLAADASRVVVMIAGLPLVLKDATQAR